MGDAEIGTTRMGDAEIGTTRLELSKKETRHAYGVFSRTQKNER
jgi:hypothetical protein